MGADESKPAEPEQNASYKYNRPLTREPAGGPNYNRPPTREPGSEPYYNRPSTREPSSEPNYNRPSTREPGSGPNYNRPPTREPGSGPNYNRPPTREPASGPAGPSTVRFRVIPPYGSYGTSVTNPTSSSSNVNLNTATGILPTPAARSNVPCNTFSSPSSPFGAQTSTSGTNATRISTPPATPNNHLYPLLQNVETESRRDEAIRNTVESKQSSNEQTNSQTRSVEESVKNFDDFPFIPSPQASELLNVPSTSSAAKMKQTHAKNQNLHNKGIGKHKGPKKNFQGNKAEFTRSTISEIENGFNLVSLQENNTAGNTNRAERTQNYRNKAQHNGLSQDTISCPICMDPMLGVVFQCHSGHALCESCYLNLPEPRVCPSCRVDMRHPIRNRALEGLIAQMKIPCLNREKGCIFSLPASNLRDHLDECIYRTMSCPIGNALGRCFWKGDLKDLKDHFQNAHPNESRFEPDVEMTVQNVNVDDRMVGLIVMGKFNFLLHVKVDMQQKRTYWLIQNIGTKNAAKNWVYEFHFYNKSEPRRKLLYTECCTSDSESADAVFARQRCAVVPSDFLATFFNAGKLNYKFFVRKTDKERNRNNDDASSEADPSENRKKGRRNNKKQ